MKENLVLGVLFVSIVAFSTAHGAPSGGFDPKGVQGSLGAGFVKFDIDSAYTNFAVDDGVFGTLQVEKGFGYHLYVTVSFNYLTTTGATNYNYTTVGGENYTGTDVNFRAHLFQPDLGLKLKIIDDGFFRPYVEGGGLFGFFEIDYTNVATAVTGPGANAKKKDTIFDLGYYGEAGVEIAFSPKWGIRAGWRYTVNKTKEFKTLANSKIEYKTQVFLLTILARF